jgi:hypothetical protein
LRVSVSIKQRHAIWQKKYLYVLLPFFILLTSVITVFNLTISANAVTSSTLNFQGRLLSSTGSLVPDGSYNIEFKLYDDDIAGTNLWTETRSGGSAVTIQNGYFSAYLGDVTPFGTSIPWDQELWLTMNVNGDGEMNPRFKLTSVPYSFRAGALVDAGGNAKTADDFAQLAPGSLQTVNAAVAALRLNQTGSGALVQFQDSGVDVFTVSNNGSTVIAGSVLAQNTTDSSSAFDVQNANGDSFLKVNTSTSQTTLGGNVGSSSTLLQGGSGGVQITSNSNVNIGQSDTSGTLLVIDTKTDAGDPAGTNGAMYYNEDSQKFRCFENGTWVDCIGGAPYEGASVNYVSGAQNITANQTAFPIENMVFQSATAVSNVAGVNGGFTAPADGSFRSCLVMNNANITAGTLDLRWRVNGVSVGSPACSMNSTSPTNRQSSSVLNPGVVTFQAGDIIDLAFDTSAAYAPTTNDFTVYWAVEYSAGGGGSGGGGYSLQDIYDQSLVASILSANNKNITFDLADTVVDSDFVVNVASGSTSRLVVQDNGTDTFSVNGAGDITSARGITLGTSSSTTAGTIRWTGTDFEGYDGASWVSLTSGSGGGGAGLNFISTVKQVNESVISSIGLQDDNELTFPIGANEEWSYRFVIQANSNAAADLRFAVTAPSGAICQVAFSDPEGSTSVGQYGCGVTSTSVPGNTAVDLYEIVGTVQNGATPGNVTLQWAQFTLNASNTIVYAGSYVNAVRSIGAGGAGQPFAQNGNAFGTTAELGTSDTNGISIITDGVERIGISSGGTSTFSGSIVANRTTTGITGTTTGTGSNTTSLSLLADSFDVDDVILIDNLGQDYYTRITADGGGGAYTVSPAVTFENTRTVTGYTIQNIGATESDYISQANRFFQGYFLGGVVIGAGSTTISDGSINSTTTLQIQSAGGDVSFGGGLTVAGAITGDGSGLTNIDGTSVDGATITALDASNISSGTLADARLSTNVGLLSGSQTFTGLKDFSSGLTVSAGNLDVTGDVDASGTITGAAIVGSGTGITALNASNIASGTIADARLSTNIALLNGGQTFSALTSFSAGISVTGAVNATGAISGATVSGDGSALTSLNATNISSGTIADGRLSTNVGLLTGSQTFTGLKDFSSGLTVSAGNLDVTGDVDASGTITGATIVGSGSGITALNASNISSGTVADARLTANIALLNGGQTFSALTSFSAGVSVTGAVNATGAISGATISGDGSALTSLNATNISSGTLADGRLSANVALLNGGQTFSALTGFGAGLSVTGAVNASGGIAGATISGDGSALTSLNATNISSGTIADGRLSANVALLTGAQTFSGSKTFSSGLVLGQSTISSLATVARAVSLPDEAGTICLSNTNTCGFLRLASGALQTDASNSDVLSVNKTSATGNLITLQRSGGAVFTVANSGALQIQATGTAALDIRNVGGTSYFSVDTSTGTVRVGSSTADAVGVLFVLDTKNTAGDPTGINGASYYNSTDEKSRCYENGVWSDCSSTRIAGETTLGGASNTINVVLNDSYEYLHCRLDTKGRSVNGGIYLRFNNNATGNAYGWNEYDIITTAVGDAQDSSDSEIQLTGTDTSNISASADLQITNFADTQKIVDWSYSGASAIGTNNRRYSGTGNWNNTANSISSVQFITSAGTFNSGSHAWCEGRNIR